MWFCDKCLSSANLLRLSYGWKVFIIINFFYDIYRTLNNKLSTPVYFILQFWSNITELSAWYWKPFFFLLPIRMQSLSEWQEGHLSPKRMFFSHATVKLALCSVRSAEFCSLSVIAEIHNFLLGYFIVQEKLSFWPMPICSQHTVVGWWQKYDCITWKSVWTVLFKLMWLN